LVAASISGRVHRDELFRPSYFNHAFTGRPSLPPTALATSSAAIGWMSAEAGALCCPPWKIGDALDEFEELRRADDCVRIRGSFDQVLLSHFCAKETLASMRSVPTTDNAT